MSQDNALDKIATSTIARLTDYQRPLNNDQLAAIGSSGDAFADAMAALEALGVPLVDSANELGNGFHKTDNKDQFVGVPLVLVMWSFHDGDFGDDPFVALHIVTRDGGKYIVTDGSTGMRDELAKWSANNSGRTHGMLCETGFGKSEYKYCEDCQTTNTKNVQKCKECNGSKNLNKAVTYYVH
ncbi:MAG: hypothetical protein ACRDUW_03365 [Pseudonocardiaceae bacterium]